MPDSRYSWKNRALALSALALVAALVAMGWLSRRAQAEDLRLQASAQAMPVVKVVAPTTVAAAGLALPARIEAWARAPLNARVGGYLKRWSADIGTPVRAGQLLAEIETPELDQQLAQARAELATALGQAQLAASTAQRWQSLLASDAVSRQAVDEKASELAARQSIAEGLRANLERLEATKRYARLVAPFDGVVTARNTDVGALVTAGATPGQELFVVSDIRRLRVFVTVPQRQVQGLRVGASATVTVPERPGQPFQARVDAMAQAIQAGTGGMLVQLTLDNRAGELLPGAFATVQFPKAESVGKVGVPPGALIYGKDGVRVALLQGDRVQIKPVRIARDLGTVVELDDGVRPHDRVIDSPPDGLRDGDRVRVTTPPNAKAS